MSIYRSQMNHFVLDLLAVICRIYRNEGPKVVISMGGIHNAAKALNLAPLDSREFVREDEH